MTDFQIEKLRKKQMKAFQKIAATAISARRFNGKLFLTFADGGLLVCSGWLADNVIIATEEV